jgi:hypothetical protein
MSENAMLMDAIGWRANEEIERWDTSVDDWIRTTPERAIYLNIWERVIIIRHRTVASTGGGFAKALATLTSSKAKLCSSLRIPLPLPDSSPSAEFVEGSSKDVF